MFGVLSSSSLWLVLLSLLKTSSVGTSQIGAAVIVVVVFVFVLVVVVIVVGLLLLLLVKFFLL